MMKKLLLLLLASTPTLADDAALVKQNAHHYISSHTYEHPVKAHCEMSHTFTTNFQFVGETEWNYTCFIHSGEWDNATILIDTWWNEKLFANDRTAGMVVDVMLCNRTSCDGYPAG